MLEEEDDAEPSFDQLRVVGPPLKVHELVIDSDPETTRALIESDITAEPVRTTYTLKDFLSMTGSSKKESEPCEAPFDEEL